LLRLLRASHTARRPRGRCQKGLPHVPDRKHSLAVRNFGNFGGVFPVFGCPTLPTANLGNNLAKLWVNSVFFYLKPGFFRHVPGKHGVLGSTQTGSPCGQQTAPLLHVRSILTCAVDAYLCRGNVLMSKRQTFLAKHKNSHYRVFTS
jgi:hypothetical protein